MKNSFRAPRGPQGFSLLFTLIILSAVVVLVVGLFSMAVTEKQVSSSFDAVEQADLALDAGFAKAVAQIVAKTSRDDYVVFSRSYGTDGTGNDLRSKNYLLIANYDYAGKWNYTPLVSGVLPPAPTTTLKAPQALDSKTGLPVPEPLLPALKYDNKTSDDAALNFPKMLPYESKPSTWWEEVRVPNVNDAQGKQPMLVARYCYMVEDLQGGLNLQTSGNYDGDGTHAASGQHMRAYFPDLNNATEVAKVTTLPVPGLNMTPTVTSPLLDQAALYTLPYPADPADTKSVDDAIMVTSSKSLRVVQFTPDMWKASLLTSGLKSTLLVRDPTTLRLPVPLTTSSDPNLREIEENSAGGVRTYREQPLIPPFPEFDAITDTSGNPILKLNLNNELNNVQNAASGATRATAMATAVTDIATFIRTHLASFEKRRGGYGTGPGAAVVKPADPGLAYLKSLASGMIGYAYNTTKYGSLGPMDETQKGSLKYDYRGMGAYPVVSEIFERWRLESGTAAPTSPVILSVTPYLELWNMTNQTITGSVMAGFEDNCVPGVGANQFSFMQIVNGKAPTSGPSAATVIAPGPTAAPDTVDGGWWLAPSTKANKNPQSAVTNPTDLPSPLTLKPNQYLVVGFQPVVFQFPSNGGADILIPNTPSTGDISSHYRLYFQPSSGGGFVLVDRALVHRDQRTVNKSNLQIIGGNNAGQTIAPGGVESTLIDSVGDPRGAFFLGDTEEVNDYLKNASPGCRNIRSDVQNTLIYSQCKPSAWPDGGHDTPIKAFVDNNSPYNGTGLGSYNTNPTDTAVQTAKFSGSPTPSLTQYEPSKAPERISAAGKFYSASELGNVFDPIMWMPATVTLPPTAPNYIPNQPQASLKTTDVRDWSDFYDVACPTTTSPVHGPALASPDFCGGNTLRIGRPEHTLFRAPSTVGTPSKLKGPDPTTANNSTAPVDRRYAASALLDLFHCGIPASTTATDVTGNLIEINGHVNINTATRDTLRALVAGYLRMDTDINTNLTSNLYAVYPSTTTYNVNPPMYSSALAAPYTQSPVGYNSAQADMIADLIIQNRPYLSPAELTERVVVPDLDPYKKGNMVSVFGAKSAIDKTGKAQGYYLATVNSASPGTAAPVMEMNDAAAEETFARIYNSSTVRSRNFRICVTAQALRVTRSGDPNSPTVLATRSRIYHVFINPKRDASGNITSQQVEITYERTL